MVNQISSDDLMKQINELQKTLEQSEINNKIGEENKDKNAPGFSEMLAKLIREVDKAQKDADLSLRKLATGETNDIHEVVMKMQEADISFKLMKEIRDKLLEAYKEIMSMS